MNKKNHQSQEDNENLRSRLKSLQQKFDCLNSEYNNLIEQNRQTEQNHFNEKSQINENLKRLKNEVENSKNEKIEKNKIIEQLNEKLLFEQKQNEKVLNDLSQMKSELKGVHSKYDALQVELLQVRAAKNNEPIGVRENISNNSIPNNSRLLRSKRSANEEVRTRKNQRFCLSQRFFFVKELQENKKPKPGTPDRSVSAANILRKPSNRKIPTKINVRFVFFSSNEGKQVRHFFFEFFRMKKNEDRRRPQLWSKTVRHFSSFSFSQIFRTIARSRRVWSSNINPAWNWRLDRTSSRCSIEMCSVNVFKQIQRSTCFFWVIVEKFNLSYRTNFNDSLKIQLSWSMIQNDAGICPHLGLSF